MNVRPATSSPPIRPWASHSNFRPSIISNSKALIQEKKKEKRKKKRKEKKEAFLLVKQAGLSQYRGHDSDFSVLHPWFSCHFSPGMCYYFFLEFHDSSLISLKLKFRPNQKKGHCHFTFLLHRHSKSLNFGLVFFLAIQLLFIETKHKLQR